LTPNDSLPAALREHVKRIVDPAGRIVGSAGHARARAYVLGQLDEIGLCPYAHDGFAMPYSAAGEDMVNVIARLPGADPRLPPVLVAAHYDTCGPLPGADDNAAAVAIALETARDIEPGSLPRDVVFAFFDAEEPPHYLTEAMGSVYFYNHQRRGPVHCALALDLLGHDVPIPSLEDLVFLTGMESHPALPGVLRETPAGGVRPLPTLNRYVGDLSDHFVFRINERPYLFLTCARWAHYHRPTDTIDKLNFEKMAAIQAYLERLVSEVARTELPEAEPADTTQDERYWLNRQLGLLLRNLGVTVEDRESIERLVAMMKANFNL
jgi:hypothetical protein